MWDPISRGEIESLIAAELAECSHEQKALFERAAITLAKWSQTPWGDEGGGFWAVAVLDGLVLWFNDLEDGFNVSRFVTPGRIPNDEYWCNQDTLCFALHNLAGHAEFRTGPPHPPDK